MSVSTDANLYYGIQLEEGINLPWADIDYWEDFYIKKMGYEHSGPSKEFIKFWNIKNCLLNEQPCAISSHCSCEYPMYYIYIKESELYASRGYPCEIPEGHLYTKAVWNRQLEEFCKIMELPYSKPSWWLSSMWC
jgi:hypothetical protein